MRALIRDLATQPAKREMFDRLAHHLTALADQVELAMLERERPERVGPPTKAALPGQSGVAGLQLETAWYYIMGRRV